MPQLKRPWDYHIFNRAQLVQNILKKQYYQKLTLQKRSSKDLLDLLLRSNITAFWALRFMNVTAQKERTW
jgi:hypothetical protein